MRNGNLKSFLVVIWDVREYTYLLMRKKNIYRWAHEETGIRDHFHMKMREG